MTDQQLFEVAAKLHNLNLGQLKLKKRYLDVVVIVLPDGQRATHSVLDLEIVAALGDEAKAATGPTAEPRPVKPQHTRKR